MRKIAVALLLTASLSAANPAVIPTAVITRAAVCAGKEVALFAASGLEELVVEKVLNEVAEELYKKIEEVWQGVFCGYEAENDSGLVKQLKGLIAEEVVRLTLKKEGFKVLNEEKLTSHAGPDVIACGNGELRVIEVKFKNAVLSGRQKKPEYYSAGVFSSACPYPPKAFVARVTPEGCGVFKVQLCALNGGCQERVVTLTEQEVKQIREKAAKQLLKLALKRMGLSDETLRRIDEVLKKLNLGAFESLEEVKAVVKELASEVKEFKEEIVNAIKALKALHALIDLLKGVRAGC
ncbi:MAG: hypothetical protein GXO03_01865 [Aquificae bacterium]|nr:hypothetical protein [Aquificota bacterium]